MTTFNNNDQNLLISNTMEFKFQGKVLTTIVYDNIDNMELNSAGKAWFCVPHYSELKIEITINGEPFMFDENIMNTKGDDYVRKYQKIFDPFHLTLLEVQQALSNNKTTNDVVLSHTGEVRELAESIAKDSWWLLRHLKPFIVTLLLFLSTFFISCGSTTTYVKVPKAQYELQQQKLHAADNFIDMLWEAYPDIMLDVYSETDTYQVLVGE